MSVCTQARGLRVRNDIDRLRKEVTENEVGKDDDRERERKSETEMFVFVNGDMAMDKV